MKHVTSVERQKSPQTETKTKPPSNPCYDHRSSLGAQQATKIECKISVPAVSVFVI